jgi:nucleoside-diphosphate-sugar epimerase
MNIFLTGGTGVLGRATLRSLAGAGHSVRASVRSEDRADLVRSLGGEPAFVDLFDGDALTRATKDSDAILHLATSIPPMAKMARRSAWQTNDRLRARTTPLLVEAARENGVGTIVAESVTFMYPDGGDGWIDESTPWPDPHPQWASTYQLEDAVRAFSADGGRGIVLRFGLFYGPEARSVDEALRLAKARIAMLSGRGDAFLSSIHTDDAAAAVAAALDAPGGVYNVVDDEPVTRREYVDAFAGAFGLKRLRLAPGAAMRAAGGKAAEILLRSQRVTNAAFRGSTTWSPRHASVRDGWTAVAAARRERTDT